MAFSIEIGVKSCSSFFSDSSGWRDVVWTNPGSCRWRTDRGRARTCQTNSPGKFAMFVVLQCVYETLNKQIFKPYPAGTESD